MDDVDHMIFDSLTNNLNCSFGDLEEAKCLNDLGSDQIVEGIVRCLWRCKPTIKESIPNYKLPRNPVDRFRIASKISNEIKSLGIREEIGYQTLLYPNVFDSRRIFLALFNKMPKETVQFEEKELSPLEKLKEDVGELISRQMAEHWVPEFCRFYDLQRIGRFWHSKTAGESHRNANEIWSQFDLVSEELNLPVKADEQQEKHKQKPALPPKPKFPPKNEAKMEITEQKSQIMDSSKSKLLTERRAKVVEQQNALLRRHLEISQLIDEVQQKEKAVEMVDDRLLVLLEDPETNVEKLQKFISEANSRRLAMEEKFFAAKNERLERLATNMGTETQQDEKLAQLEMQVAVLEDQLEQKRRIKAKLLKETNRTALEHQNEDMESRNRFVRRILDLSAMVSKQNDEIRRTANSVQTIRKEICQLDGNLDRTFTAVSRWMSEVAERDAKMQRSHKLLVRTHEQCALVRTAIQALGQLSCQKIELENRVDLESQKRVDDQLEKLLNDLMAIRSENHEMDVQLASREQQRRTLDNRGSE